MDSFSLFRTSVSICAVLLVAGLAACQSSSRGIIQRPGGFIRETHLNSVFVAEYRTKPDETIDIREYRLDGQMPVLIFVDKNHDGRPDLLLKQDASTGMVKLMISDSDLDGHYDTFVVPGILTLKDIDGDGWPEEYWKGFRRPVADGDAKGEQQGQPLNGK